jgi:hypothetical protein
MASAKMPATSTLPRRRDVASSKVLLSALYGGLPRY